MINATAQPRGHLTKAQVTAILVSPAISVSSGLEIIDPNTLVAKLDLSDKLLGGNVRRDNYAKLHGSCLLNLTERSDFTASTLFRPYMTIGDKETGLEARFNLGAYYLTNPTAPLHGGSVAAEGFDVLLAMHDLVGDTYSRAAGNNYIGAVKGILASRGLTATIETSEKTLPTTRVWAMDDEVTWLDICNDLLAAAGYRNLWSDENGRIRADPFRRANERSPEWTYNPDDVKTIVGVDRFLTSDTFQAPNRWIFIRDNPSGGATVADNGIYEYENETSGPTSSSELGRTVTRTVRLEAASQADLETQAAAIIEQDSDPDAVLELSTGPNPLHWHFDVVEYIDAQPLFVPTKYAARSWELDVATGKMNHVWKALR
jgi:hypothetical protein